MRSWLAVVTLLALPLLHVCPIQAAVNTTTPDASAADASGLKGATLSYQYYYGGVPYESRHNFVVGSGSGIAGEIGAIFHNEASEVFFGILASDTSITFDYSITTGPSSWIRSKLSLPPTVHNGLSITRIIGPPFVSVTIDPVTNMRGFDSSRISFTANQIQVDWQGLSFDSHTIVRLDVNAGAEAIH